MRQLLLMPVILALVSCTTTMPRGSDVMSDYFHWREAENAHGWAVFLPGSSGLTVFDDDHHYFDAAQRLNEAGWSVLLVDYKPAYRAAIDPPDGSAGEKIAWVTESAIEWLHSERGKTAVQPGAIVAWSLGAEGALLFDGERADKAGVHAIAMYYPSNRGDTRFSDPPPALILTGESDDVTPLDSVIQIAKNREGNTLPQVELHAYPNALHGFDIASLQERKVVRILPGIGPKATLQYNEAAANDAQTRLNTFFANVAQP